MLSKVEEITLISVENESLGTEIVWKQGKLLSETRVKCRLFFVYQIA